MPRAPKGLNSYCGWRERAAGNVATDAAFGQAFLSFNTAQAEQQAASEMALAGNSQPGSKTTSPLQAIETAPKSSWGRRRWQAGILGAAGFAGFAAGVVVAPSPGLSI